MELKSLLFSFHLIQSVQVLSQLLTPSIPYVGVDTIILPIPSIPYVGVDTRMIPTPSIPYVGVDTTPYLNEVFRFSTLILFLCFLPSRLKMPLSGFSYFFVVIQLPFRRETWKMGCRDSITFLSWFSYLFGDDLALFVVVYSIPLYWPFIYESLEGLFGGTRA